MTQNITKNTKILKPNTHQYGCAWIPSDFEIGKLLGEGVSGQVYIGRDKLTKKRYAIKVITKKSLKKDDMQNLKTEIAIQMSLDHPNILKMYGWCENATRIFLILEYAPNGNLFELWEKKEKRFTQQETVKYATQIAEALKYCHSKGVVHRDVKLENVLLNSKNDIKICDFGSSALIEEGERLDGQYGTPVYVSPEVLNENYDHKTDIWSFGVLCYELLIGSNPFEIETLTKEQTYLKISNMDYDYPSEVPNICKDFIDRLLTTENLRLSWEEIFDLLKQIA
jgi:serine/threonine protein kinase